MNNLQFTLLRFISVPIALMLVFDWAILPSNLQVAQSNEQLVSAQRSTFKGQEVAYISTPSDGELRISCSDAGPLCNALRGARQRTLRVWLQKPTPLHGSWVVAAKDNDKDVVRPDDIRSAYLEFKVIWGVFALVCVAVAFASWYFVPFSRENPDAP